MRNLKRFKRYFITAGIATFVLILSLIAYFVPPGRLLTAIKIPKISEGEVRLHFLDVGQGDCTIAEFSDGEILLIDAGEGGFEAENKLIRYVKGLHPKTIHMILTHADSDHYGGFLGLLKNFEVTQAFLPILSSENKNYTNLMQAIEKEGCETNTLSRYSTIPCNGGYFVCLSPYSQGESEENDSSTVLYLNCGGVDALFCADISSVREKRLMREYAMDSTIFSAGESTVDLSEIDLLKVAHHGSAGSSAPEWLNLLCPKVSILTCGRGNHYGFPRAEVLENIKSASPDGEIYRLDELGDLMVTIKDGTYRVEAREL